MKPRINKVNELYEKAQKKRIQDLERQIEILKKNQPEPPKELNWLQYQWYWLNGKKTIIGVTAGALGKALTLVTDPVAQVVGWGLVGLGSLLGFVGVSHKAAKASPIGPKGEFGWKEFIQLIINILTKLKEVK